MEEIFERYKEDILCDAEIIYIKKNNYKNIKRELTKFISDILDFGEVEYLYLYVKRLDLLNSFLYIHVKTKDNIKDLKESIKRARKYNEHYHKFNSLCGLTAFIYCVKDGEKYKNCFKIYKNDNNELVCELIK